MTEKEFNALLEYTLRKNGAEGGWKNNGFIVASGERSALPHGVPTGRAFRKGDIVTVDFGATVEGYMSDLTRNFSLGPLSPQGRDIQDTLLEAHLRAAEAIRPGAEGRAVDAVARDVITRRDGENISPTASGTASDWRFTKRRDSLPIPGTYSRKVTWSPWNPNLHRGLGRHEDRGRLPCHRRRCGLPLRRKGKGSPRPVICRGENRRNLFLRLPFLAGNRYNEFQETQSEEHQRGISHEKVRVHRVRLCLRPRRGRSRFGSGPRNSFEDIPDDWVCPVCAVGKDMFEPENKKKE